MGFDFNNAVLAFVTMTLEVMMIIECSVMLQLLWRGKSSSIVHAVGTLFTLTLWLWEVVTDDGSATCEVW